MAKHYEIKIRTHSGKTIKLNYYGDENKLFKRFTELAEWHEFEQMAIFAKGKEKPLLTYN